LIQQPTLIRSCNAAHSGSLFSGWAAGVGRFLRNNDCPTFFRIQVIAGDIFSIMVQASLSRSDGNLTSFPNKNYFPENVKKPTTY